MSENVTNEMENEAIEVTVSDPPEESAADDGVDAACTTEPSEYIKGVSENTEVPEAPAEKQGGMKRIASFIRHKIFTPKVCGIVLLSLGILMTLLCILQMVFWGLSVKDTYMSYWQAIISADYINIAITAFMVLFVVVLLVNVIRSIVSLIKKGHTVRFEMITTMLAFGLFSMFISKIFAGKELLITSFSYSLLLAVLVGLVLAYAFFRLFVYDIKSRICPFLFSCGTIAVAIILYAQAAGNFATIVFETSESVPLADMSVYRYFEAYFDYYGVTGQPEADFLAYGLNTHFYRVDDMQFLVLPLQVLVIAVANILPFVSLSLLGYLAYGLVSKNYIQYYQLHSCQKVSISMLVISLLSFAATFALKFLAYYGKASFSIRINYVNAIVTIALCVILIVLTSLPWKIYNIIYRRRFAAYQRNEGGNV